MKALQERISSIDNKTKELIEKKLKEFKSFAHKNYQDWFSELCFCILTANSKAKTAISIQNQLGFHGFSTLPRNKLAEIIRKNKHRFHNTKASYIIEARKHLNIKDKINRITKEKNTIEAREFLVNNIKGLGFKEASHFLRNTGNENIAILDRHILSLLKEHEIINKIPKSLYKSSYLDIEKQFLALSKKLNISPGKLDLMMWYLKTGDVLK